MPWKSLALQVVRCCSKNSSDRRLTMHDQGLLPPLMSALHLHGTILKSIFNLERTLCRTGDWVRMIKDYLKTHQSWFWKEYRCRWSGRCSKYSGDGISRTRMIKNCWDRCVLAALPWTRDNMFVVSTYLKKSPTPLGSHMTNVFTVVFWSSHDSSQHKSSHHVSGNHQLYWCASRLPFKVCSILNFINTFFSLFYAL